MQLNAQTNADIIGASRQNASEASQVVDLTKLDPAVTAQHLGKPEGEIGRALADSMAERNWPVYEAAIKLVGLRPAERLIEIGFGNGKLVPQLLALAPGATYAGVDFSATMVAEAEAFNSDLIDAGRARFHLASVEVIPLADRSFDRALTINTIYFWPDPVRALAEIRRVLRPDGALLVSAQTPEEAEKAPYTRHGFRIYDEAQLRQLHKQAGFRRVGVELYRDTAPTLDRSGTRERQTYFVIAFA
jgi:SAM-dependent methyltransferase